MRHHLPPECPLEPIISVPQSSGGSTDKVERLEIRSANRPGGFTLDRQRGFSGGAPSIAELGQGALRDADLGRKVGLRDAVVGEVGCKLVCHAA